MKKRIRRTKRRAGTGFENRYAQVKSGIVINVIEIAPDSDWTIPAGTQVVPDPTGAAAVGGTWNGSTFGPAPVPVPPADQADFDQAVAVLRNQFGNARTIAQVNNALDATTVILRRLFRELRVTQAVKAARPRRSKSGSKQKRH